MRLWTTAALLLALAIALYLPGAAARAQPPLRGPGAQDGAAVAAPGGDAKGAGIWPSGGATGSSAAAGQEEGKGGPDILFMALITMGAVLGTGAVGLVLYLIRLRTGFWLHRPPPREGGEHH